MLLRLAGWTWLWLDEDLSIIRCEGLIVGSRLLGLAQRRRNIEVDSTLVRQLSKLRRVVRMAFDGGLREGNLGVLLRWWWRRVIVILGIVHLSELLLVLLLQMRLLVMPQIRVVKLLLVLTLEVDDMDQMLLGSCGRTNSTEVCPLLSTGGLDGVGPGSHAHWWAGTIFSGGQGHASRLKVPQTCSRPCNVCCRTPAIAVRDLGWTQRSGSELETTTVIVTAEIWGRRRFGVVCHESFSSSDAHGHF